MQTQSGPHGVSSHDDSNCSKTTMAAQQYQRTLEPLSPASQRPSSSSEPPSDSSNPYLPSYSPPPTGSPSLSEEGNIAGRVLTRSASPSLKPNLFLEHSAIQECRHYALRRSKLTLLCRFSLRKKSNPACHQSAREVIQGLGDYVLGYVAYLQGSPCIAQVISVDRDLINIYVRRANHSAKLQLTS